MQYYEEKNILYNVHLTKEQNKKRGYVKKKNHSVSLYDKNTNEFIKKYNSLYEMLDDLKISRTSYANACKVINKDNLSFHGYKLKRE